MQVVAYRVEILEADSSHCHISCIYDGNASFRVDSAVFIAVPRFAFVGGEYRAPLSSKVIMSGWMPVVAMPEYVRPPFSEQLNTTAFPGFV